MKKTLIFAVALVFCHACRNDAKLFLGDYSYKTSGNVTIKTDSTTISYKLADKIGQLNVVNLKANKNDSVLLVFNELGGALTTVRAYVANDSVYLIPYTKIMTFVLGAKTIESEICITGKGVRYDNMIMLDEVYDGKVVGDSINTTIKGDRIATVANRN